jgi:hypothetical protein
MAFGGCTHHDRTVQSQPYVPTAAEQRRIDERRAEERLAEERRAEDRRHEAELRAEERRLADEQRAADERRIADERRAAEQRRIDERRERPIGGGPNEPVLRATPASAVASIAGARCDREVRCGHVSARDKWRTRAACVAEMKRDRRDDLNSDVCPGGIREKELNDCLVSIRDEDCGNPLDSIARLNACRSGNLCVK